MFGEKILPISLIIPKKSFPYILSRQISFRNLHGQPTVREDEGNYSGRGQCHPSLSAFESDIQANNAGVRQTDDLLSAFHADAGGNS